MKWTTIFVVELAMFGGVLHPILGCSMPEKGFSIPESV
jgi:hypothetical protein